MKLTISVLAALTAFGGMSPSYAAPVLPSANPSLSSQVETVKYRGRDRDRSGWHNRYQGDRNYRRGYRRHNDGLWYPLAAFGAAAIIGGAIASQPRATTGINPRHYEWCESRYRSYRASDNSFAVRVGVRAECRSPYY